MPGDHIVLVANPDFYGEGPHLERLIIKYVPDLTVLFTQFQTGDIDYIGLQGITADHYEEATKLADRVVTPVPQPFIENIACNLGLPQLKERAVREALYYGMDKQSIIEAIYYGLPKPTESVPAAAVLGLQPGPAEARVQPRQGQADAGRGRLGAGPDGIREKDGVRLEFVNSTTAGNHVREQAQQFLQQNWLEIGVKMNINNLPPAVMWGDYWMQSKFETAMVGIGFMIGPDPDATDFSPASRSAPRAAPGRTRASTAARRSTSCCRRGKHVRPRQARKPIYRRMQEVTGTTCPTCRSSSTRRSRAPRPASRASSPTSTSR